MKKLYLLLLLPLMLSCGGNSDGMSEVGKMLKGEHELRKFKVKTEEGYAAHGSYFLFSGGFSAGTYKNEKVTFSFQLPDSSYAMAEMSFEDIRVKIDSTIKRPYVTFNWNPGSNVTNMRWVFQDNVNYMVVHCKEEDFPYEVNITDL